MKKTYVWALPTRLFHSLLIISIILAFILSESENLLPYHAAIGYGVGVLIVFRIIWGLIGPKYSRFKDFPLSIKEAIEFSLSIFHPKKKYLGHNPAASFVMIALIIVLFFVTLSGVLTYGIQEGRGIVGFLNSSFFKEMELFEEIHEFFTTLLLFLIVIHLIGVVIDYLFHREDETWKSIFTGYKNIEGEPVSLTLFHKFIAFLFFIIFIIVIFVAVQKDSIFQASIYNKVEYNKLSATFVEECSACHTLYPPFLLSKQSWKKLMQKEALANHFGDDASLDEATRVAIKKFLIQNSAQTSTKEASVYIGQNPNNNDIIAMTQSSYWKEKHKNIDKNIFKSKKVISKANCKACHSDIEKGLIEDSNIKIPKGV